MCVACFAPSPPAENPSSNSSCDGGTGCAKKTIDVQLVSLEFTSDHDLLTSRFSTSKDANQLKKDGTRANKDLNRWEAGGLRFKDLDKREYLESSHNYPISQTKETVLKVTLEFAVGPADAPTETGQVDIFGGEPFLRFSKVSASFSPTKKDQSNLIKVSLTAKAPLPDKIQLLQAAFKWRVEIMGRVLGNTTGPHRIYVTHDTPSAKDDQSGAPQPDGVTWQRMHGAMTLVEKVDKPAGDVIDVAAPKGNVKETVTRAHAIVKGLMEFYPNYTLHPIKKLEFFNHPTYFNLRTRDPKTKKVVVKPMPSGAWPMIDYISASGECQAIVRLVANILRILGVPGKAETVFIFASTAPPHDTLENSTGNAYSRHALMDGKVVAGEIHPPSHTDLPGGKTSPGFNNFEASLKFTEGGKILYYPGGTGGSVHKDKDTIIAVFHSFVEVAGEPNAKFTDANGNTVRGGIRIVKILKKY